MIRSLKKLKIWSSRRKKKKKKHFICSSYSPPPPPTRPAPLPPLTHCCSCSAATPSAPPLPAWLDFEPNHITDSGSKDEIYYRESISETASLYPPSALHSLWRSIRAWGRHTSRQILWNLWMRSQRWDHSDPLLLSLLSNSWQILVLILVNPFPSVGIAWPGHWWCYWFWGNILIMFRGKSHPVCESNPGTLFLYSLLLVYITVKYFYCFVF